MISLTTQKFLTKATQEGDGFAGLFEETYKYEPYNLTVKGTVEAPKRNFKGEVTLDKLVDGLTVKFNGESGRRAKPKS